MRTHPHLVHRPVRAARRARAPIAEPARQRLVEDAAVLALAEAEPEDRVVVGRKPRKHDLCLGRAAFGSLPDAQRIEELTTLVGHELLELLLGLAGHVFFLSAIRLLVACMNASTSRSSNVAHDGSE